MIPIHCANPDCDCYRPEYHNALREGRFWHVEPQFGARVELGETYKGGRIVAINRGWAGAWWVLLDGPKTETE